MSEINKPRSGSPVKLRAVEESEASGEAFPKSELWSRLKDAKDPRSYAAAWLELQCSMIDGALQGVVILAMASRGPLTPVAWWPEGTDGGPNLSTATETAIRGKRPVVQGGKPAVGLAKAKPAALAYPLILEGRVFGAAAIEIEPRPEEELDAAMRQLEWGCGWLEVLGHGKTFMSKDRLVAVLEMLATSLHHERFQAAVTAVATELAGTLRCERVEIGFVRGRHTQLRAMSHSASFAKKGNLVRAIELAMDEAIDQQATVVYPPTEGGPFQVMRAHAALSKEHGSGSICTVPFTEGGRLLGALTLERPADDPFDPRTIQLCEHAATLIGPVLEIKRKDDRWLIQKAADSLYHLLQNLIGPRHVVLKLSVCAVVLVAVFLVFAQGDYRITADATLEGTVQRVIAAPIPGYVADAHVRAGDIVRAGQVLASLDDRDLRVERLRWTSQRAELKRAYDEAIATHDRPQMRILNAQIEQAEAQIALIDEQLARTRIVAPFDGIVIAGDLSQSLGAPLEQGDVLFTLAPLDAYRVIFKVDEREIRDVSVGQQGSLALTSMPGELLPLVVEKITPVSSAEEGRNYFRVEAHLESVAPTLRPGMEGVGKIQVDQRRLVWIWTYKIVHWVRMFLWSWWP